MDWGAAADPAGFCWWGSGGLLDAIRAGAWAWAGGMKEDDFWALLQARVAVNVAANSAERMTAR